MTTAVLPDTDSSTNNTLLAIKGHRGNDVTQHNVCVLASEPPATHCRQHEATDSNALGAVAEVGVPQAGGPRADPATGQQREARYTYIYVYIYIYIYLL